jgi:gamma-glutamyltranspeptidase/glutathione hydrolase
MFTHESHGLHDVTSYGGMSSSSHPWATAAGVQMLMRGGNAVDAAIATAFGLAVCEPAMSHLGGQGNMLVRMANEPETVAIDFYACAPGSAGPDMYRWIESPTQGDYRFWTEGDRNTTGALSVCIPGNVCGWVTAHRRWGRLPLAVVTRPAATYAREGVPLTGRMAAFVTESRDRLAQFPSSAAVFLRPDGSPRLAGEVIEQPQLADTIELIAAEGHEVFYQGEIAQAMVRQLAAAGGVLSPADLERYPEELMWVRRPDEVPFKGFTVQGATPSANALLLHLLRLVDGLDFSAMEPLSGDKVHLLVEAMKLAFAERTVHIGDHTQVNVPLQGLLDPRYVADRLELIRADRASFPGPGDPWRYQELGPDPAKVTGAGAEAAAEAGCTTHHSHVDRWGNFVSLTQSLGDAFGSALMVDGYGFFLNNAMKLFDPRPSARVAGIAPYKRPLTPWPTLVLQGGRPVLSLGSPSGTRIPNAITQVLINIIEHRMALQDAVNLPRVHWSGHEFEAEKDLPEEAKSELARRGHEIEYRNSRSPWFGAVQAVARDPVSGLCQGAADPRRQGAAAGASLLFDDD